MCVFVSHGSLVSGLYCIEQTGSGEISDRCDRQRLFHCLFTPPHQSEQVRRPIATPRQCVEWSSGGVSQFMDGSWHTVASRVV